MKCNARFWEQRRRMAGFLQLLHVTQLEGGPNANWLRNWTNHIARKGQQKQTGLISSLGVFPLQTITLHLARGFRSSGLRITCLFLQIVWRTIIAMQNLSRKFSCAEGEYKNIAFLLQM